MQFLADVELICEECRGTRFKSSVLEVRYREKNIHEVLGLTVREALQFFSGVPKVLSKLKVLDEVGLGYLRLGQSATTLSGGEAQRLKLAAHLIHTANPGVLYIFDEPTTGLHFDDIQKLLTAFRKLLEGGASIVVIEHNLDVIKSADWVIDLGPGRRRARRNASSPPARPNRSRATRTPTPENFWRARLKTNRMDTQILETAQRVEPQTANAPESASSGNARGRQRHLNGTMTLKAKAPAHLALRLVVFSFTAFLLTGDSGVAAAARAQPPANLSVCARRPAAARRALSPRLPRRRSRRSIARTTQPPFRCFNKSSRKSLTKRSRISNSATPIPNSSAMMTPQPAYRRAIELDPKLVAAHINLGLVLLDSDPAAALASFRRAADLTPTEGRPHYLEGRALERSGKLPEAIEEYRSAAAMTPKDADYPASRSPPPC